MFSSEQIFEISGEMDQLEKTIKFAIDMHGIGKSGICYQVTEDGKYCLGWGFLMKVIPTTCADDWKGIKNPFFGIVSIEPFINFYAK